MVETGWNPWSTHIIPHFEFMSNFPPFDFFRLIRIQSSMMSVIKKWNWKDFDYSFISCQIFHHCDFSTVSVQAIFSFVNNLKWKNQNGGKFDTKSK